MNYVVDPMWFYWISVADNLIVFFTILTIAIGFIFLIHIVVWAFLEDETFKPFSKRTIILGILAAVCLLISVFIPSKETLIEMEISKHVTYENVELLIDSTKEAADYILDELKGEQK